MKDRKQELNLILVATLLWQCGNWIARRSPFVHDPIDQHTRQALAWLSGHLTIQTAPWLEIAEFRGQHFNSFPPTPTLLELPLTLVFKSQTPNHLAVFFVMLAALVAMFRMAKRAGFRALDAALLCLTFVFGTNLFTSLISGGVWAHGQILAFCLCVLSFAIIDGPGRKKWPAYLLLALAVGCRPFSLFYLPALFAFDCFKTRRPIKTITLEGLLASAPFLLTLAFYNYIRFLNPLEFGHKYLPWSRSLSDGIFSFAYFRRNFFHAFLKLPSFHSSFLLNFDGRGTAFWLNNPIFVFSLAAILRPGWQRELRVSFAISLFAVWFGLLLHESNGWYQFGYRYLIDLLPIGFVTLTLMRPERSGLTRPVLTGVFAYSLLINAFGIWWYHFAR